MLYKFKQIKETKVVHIHKQTVSKNQEVLIDYLKLKTLSTLPCNTITTERNKKRE
jgi:hypothetical protein